MTATAQSNCRVEYRRNEIVIHGPPAEAQREADRIMRRFACSATPYQVSDHGNGHVVLRPE